MTCALCGNYTAHATTPDGPFAYIECDLQTADNAWSPDDGTFNGNGWVRRRLPALARLGGWLAGCGALARR